jgi:hypothetical protein
VRRRGRDAPDLAGHGPSSFDTRSAVRVRSLTVSAWKRGHRARVPARQWPCRRSNLLTITDVGRSRSFLGTRSNRGVAQTPSADRWLGQSVRDARRRRRWEPGASPSAPPRPPGEASRFTAASGRVGRRPMRPGRLDSGSPTEDDSTSGGGPSHEDDRDDDRGR